VSAVIEATQRAARAHTVSRDLALLRGRNGMILAAGALFGFGALFTAVKAKRSEEVDIAITLRLQARQHRSIAALMEATSWPGFPPQSHFIPPVIISTLFVMRLRTEAAFQLLAWGTGGISTVVKGFVHRPRPLPEQVRVVLAPLGGSSFPSGHVLTYVGTYGFLAYLTYTLIRPPEVRWPVSLGLVGMIGLVGPSRIYQGHHWPTDVAASYFLGTSYLIAVLALYRRFRRRPLGVDDPIAE
jgi:membrane-associated phospholipid phosphatase